MKKFGINNLWKYDLPNSWRLIYTIKTNEVMILNVILTFVQKTNVLMQTLLKKYLIGLKISFNFIFFSNIY